MKRKPTPAEIEAAKHKTLPDLIRPGIDILLVGINPSLYSAALGLHFARPGNRFWPAMVGAGFAPPGTTAWEQGVLLHAGVGITNIAPRPTAAADELSAEELVDGARALLEKVRRYRPRVLAFLGASAYRIAFDAKKAPIGRQPETIGTTEVWVLPNPSGLNANYQLPQLIELYTALKGDPCTSSSPSPRASKPRATSRSSSTSSSAASTRRTRRSA